MGEVESKITANGHNEAVLACIDARQLIDSRRASVRHKVATLLGVVCRTNIVDGHCGLTRVVRRARPLVA